jgi:hypothetical protein
MVLSEGSHYKMIFPRWASWGGYNDRFFIATRDAGDPKICLSFLSPYLFINLTT